MIVLHTKMIVCVGEFTKQQQKTLKKELIHEDDLDFSYVFSFYEIHSHSVNLR